MLASKHRLTGQQVEIVKNEGILHQLTNFGVILKKTQPQNPSRFGFIVSNKVSKLAIQRNRIKRAMSESIRYNLTNIPNGYDVIYLVKSTLAKKSTDEIMNITKNSLKRLKLLK